MEDKTATRILKYATQSWEAGHPVTIAVVAKRFKVTQTEVFELIVDNDETVDMEVGYIEDGDWVAYSAIGDYVIRPATDWMVLSLALASCRGKHVDPAVNDLIAQLEEAL